VVVRTCIRCGAVVPPSPGRRRICPQCASGEEWNRWGRAGRRIVITRDELAEARARLGAPQRLDTRLRLARPALPAVLALAVAAATAVLISRLLRPWQLGALADFQAGVVALAKGSTLAGAAAALCGCWAAIRVARSRLFRSIPLIVSTLLAVGVGVAGLVVGGLFWAAAARGFGMEYTSMPPLSDIERFPPGERAAVVSTAIVLAANESGDARELSIGTGAVVHTSPSRTWIVTNSHVAMPYAAVGSFRDASGARPVWIYLADGRNDEGRVRWVAPPPLDLALLSVELGAAPGRARLTSLQGGAPEGSRVFAVPNPFRHGWRVLHGRVLRRVELLWPTGPTSLYHTDLPLLPGDSGSALYDETVRVLALNTWGTVDPEDAQGLSLPVRALEGVIAEVERAEPAGIGQEGRR